MACWPPEAKLDPTWGLNPGEPFRVKWCHLDAGLSAPACRASGTAFNLCQLGPALCQTHRSHENLDNATFYDADLQLSLNKAMAATVSLRPQGLTLLPP